MNDNEELEYFKSEEFQVAMQKQITKDTWAKGLPKIYMDDNGDIIEHWKDGKIRILSTKEQLRNEKN